MVALAATKRRSSNWPGVKCAGRHSLPLIVTTHDNAHRWRCYFPSVN